jgi:hypothetical protein
MQAYSLALTVGYRCVPREVLVKNMANANVLETIGAGKVAGTR